MNLIVGTQESLNFFSSKAYTKAVRFFGLELVALLIWNNNCRKLGSIY